MGFFFAGGWACEWIVPGYYFCCYLRIWRNYGEMGREDEGNNLRLSSAYAV